MGGVGRQFIVGATFGNRHKRCLSGQHARLDGGMAALDACRVQVTRIATNQCATWEHGFGQGLGCAIVDGTCAIANAFAALQMFGDAGVCFPTLHFLERAHIGVGVVQPQHKAQGHFVVFQVVEESATKAVVFYGPTRGVHHQARFGQCGVHFPQFFDANGKGLAVLALVQCKAFNDLFAQVSPCTFGKHGVLGV